MLEYNHHEKIKGFVLKTHTFLLQKKYHKPQSGTYTMLFFQNTLYYTITFSRKRQNLSSPNLLSASNSIHRYSLMSEEKTVSVFSVSTTFFTSPLVRRRETSTLNNRSKIDWLVLVRMFKVYIPTSCPSVPTFMVGMDHKRAPCSHSMSRAKINSYLKRGGSHPRQMVNPHKKQPTKFALITLHIWTQWKWAYYLCTNHLAKTKFFMP